MAELTRGNPGKDPGSCNVTIAHHQPGLKYGCKKCGKTLGTGYYVVLVVVTYPEKEFRYVLAKRPIETCCDQDVEAFYLFDDADKAQEKVNETIEKINASGDTKELRLFTLIDLIKSHKMN